MLFYVHYFKCKYEVVMDFVVFFFFDHLSIFFFFCENMQERNLMHFKKENMHFKKESKNG